ncbi:MAG TPA: hypothetical protein VIB39_11425 [Candidatus Angelobacter sp.]|jgi:hypothetical protein
MDPVKVIIFVAAFLLLLMLGKKLSGSGAGRDFIVPPLEGSAPPINSSAALPGSDDDEDEDAPLSTSRLTGADLPFPVKIPEIECDPDGRYNRPEFLNYYFEKTDLKNGPADPASFSDDLYLVTRDIGSNHEGHYRYLVATPAGLQGVMASERLPALYIDGQTIIVPRWDLPLILETVIKQIMKDYAEPGDKQANALPNEDA